MDGRAEVKCPWPLRAQLRGLDDLSLLARHADAVRHRDRMIVEVDPAPNRIRALAAARRARNVVVYIEIEIRRRNLVTE